MKLLLLSKATKIGGAVAILFMVLSISSAVIGQEATTATQASAPSNTQDIFVPESQVDPRFNLKNISFDLRLDPRGRGEILDVVFELENNTRKPLELYGYVVAFTETDAVDESARLWIPYPNWRKRDPSRETYLVRNISITPEDIDQSLIWNENDPVYLKTERTFNRLRTSVGASVQLMDMFPPLSQYLSYITKNPAKGVKFLLHGTKGPGSGNKIHTNYLPPEKAREANVDPVLNHTFTIEYFQRKTIFRSHHMAHYQANYQLFNTVSIILFDAAKVDNKTNANGKNDGVVYYRTFKIDRELRIL